uniref:Kinesin light chain n=1 Tax=Pseudictyota dubia TaxID=2749911 RepID=A0A7R9WB83_9STRA|mmetsp:Transcript_40719/g.75384  ORF Transcript_40719/g.75384 Transcript_40719/m.75384 type:complete len:175 (+) Transcript_40719:209-733(+)
MTLQNVLKRAVACVPGKPSPSAEVWDGADGRIFYQRGADHAKKEEWREATIMYNRALKLQRHALGENHVDCARTLNDVGVALTHLGESYSAMVSLEEALWIRQKALGDGHPDVAETTCNLWSLLEQQRESEKAGDSSATQEQIEKLRKSISMLAKSTEQSTRQISASSKNARSA